MFYFTVENDLSSAQWQFLVGHLLAISNILYDRASGAGFQVGTTNGHPPNGGCDHVHIGESHDSSLMTQLMLTLDIPGAANSPMGMDPTGTSRPTPTGSGVCRQAATPDKPHGRDSG